MGSSTRAQSSGVNWGPSGFPPQAVFLGCSSPRRETISSGEGFRGAQEAVVSDDPSGQQNPLASQGPRDGRVGVAGSRALLNRKALERVIPLGIMYSWERELRWRRRRSHGADVDGTSASGRRRRSPLTVHLKPYWGKPTVRNFRGGRGNPKLDRARRAPLPYSAEHLFAWRTTTTARLTDAAEAMGNDLDPVLCTVGPATPVSRRCEREWRNLGSNPGSPA